MSSLISIIFWLIVAYFIVKNLNSSKKSNKSDKKKKKSSPEYNETPVYTPPVSKKKKSKPTSTPDVLRRAKQNVAEDFDDKKPTASDYEKIFASSPSVPSSAEAQTPAPAPVVSDFHAEPSETATAIDVENLLKETQDLIVLGYHAKLPYERDFIAEGMALIDQYKY